MVRTLRIFPIIIKELLLTNKSSYYSLALRTTHADVLQVTFDNKDMQYSKTPLIHDEYFLLEHLFNFQWNKLTLDSL